jgi:hypothetical protein
MEPGLSGPEFRATLNIPPGLALLRGNAKVERRVVVVDCVQQGRKTAVGPETNSSCTVVKDIYTRSPQPSPSKEEKQLATYELSHFTPT